MESQEGRAKLRQVRLSRTVALMESEDAKERFKAEYRQLVVRIEGLKDAIKYYSDTYSPLEIDLYYQQLIAMTNYRNVLELRATVMDLEL